MNAVNPGRGRATKTIYIRALRS